MKFSGKTVLITGASSGIGMETAFKFAKEGARLIITYRKDKKTTLAVMGKCKLFGARDVAVLKLDVTQNDDIRKAVDEVRRKFKKISVFVNNAGVLVEKPLAKQSDKEIETQLRVNLEGLIKLTRSFLPLISGMIINIASIRGKIARADGVTPYTASKFGVRGFTQALAKEYPRLRVFAVNPDLTATPMTNFAGRSASSVAEVIVNAAKGKYGVKTGGDVDVWKVLK